MKILLELDISIDSSLGDELNGAQLKGEINRYFSKLLSKPEEEFSEFGHIDVPSDRCWDCYSHISFNHVVVV